jgi:hypothetical protein
VSNVTTPMRFAMLLASSASVLISLSLLRRGGGGFALLAYPDNARVHRYGKVEDPNPDRVTSFKPSSKIYGGTKHYPAFKSTSTTMKPGLCTK